MTVALSASESVTLTALSTAVQKGYDSEKKTAASLDKKMVDDSAYYWVE
jgi:hypothetical protein